MRNFIFEKLIYLTDIFLFNLCIYSFNFIFEKLFGNVVEKVKGSFLQRL